MFIKLFRVREAGELVVVAAPFPLLKPNPDLPIETEVVPESDGDPEVAGAVLVGAVVGTALSLGGDLVGDILSVAVALQQLEETDSVYRSNWPSWQAVLMQDLFRWRISILGSTSEQPVGRGSGAHP